VVTLNETTMTTKRIAFLTLSLVLMATLLGGALFAQTTQKGSIYRYLSIFSQVFDLVRDNYVEDVSSDKLMDGAFTGVTDAVDEFSYYVPPDDLPAFKKFTDVEDNGLGIIVTKRFGFAYVIATVAGSPAEKAGLERGTFIERIDGQGTEKMAVWQIRSALHQTRPVKLRVLRGGETKREEVTVAPTPFHPVPIETDTISGIAYIKIPYFEEGTAAQFHSALEQARKSGARKLIVDLRGNAGGSVDEAILSADELLTSGLITSLEGRKIEAKRWQADRATAFDGEVEVLTDASTASGAEMFAAAIHGNNRGKVIGVTTYGKAIVQRLISLPSGGAVEMTVGHYTTPDLKPITDAGIRPDILVDLSAQALAQTEDKDGNPVRRRKAQEDLILKKALELFGAEPSAVAEKKAT
jgi:carboxyl-terminal processing protease